MDHYCSIVYRKKIRGITNVPLSEFKQKLDNFLTDLPDEPKIGTLIPGAMDRNGRWSNSIIDQIARRTRE